MGFFSSLMSVVVGIASVLLIFMVILQSNKGSDLGLFGGSSEMVFGSQRMNAFAKITIVLATIIIGGVFFVGLVKVKTSSKQVVIEEARTGKTLKEIVAQPSPPVGGALQPKVINNPKNSADNKANTTDTIKPEANNKSKDVKSGNASLEG